MQSRRSAVRLLRCTAAVPGPVQVNAASYDKPRMSPGTFSNIVEVCKVSEKAVNALTNAIGFECHAISLQDANAVIPAACSNVCTASCAAPRRER